MIYFILGGQSSGKTARGLAIAESLAESLPQKNGAGLLVYVATAMVGDDEMKKKSLAHVAERQARQKNWQTVEEAVDICAVIKSQKGATMVVDSLAMWLFNIINAKKNIGDETKKLLARLQDSDGNIVIVSDEINFSPIAATAETRAFCQALGLLHQAVGSLATHVELMVAGIPHKIK